MIIWGSIVEDHSVTKALHVLEVMNFNDDECQDYENHLKWLRIQNNTIRNYEQRGERRGRQQEKQAIALLMLYNHEPVEKISLFTSLGSDEIEQLALADSNTVSK